jgi:hypothetical protein
LNVNEDILIVCGAFDADIVKLSALAWVRLLLVIC